MLKTMFLSKRMGIPKKRCLNWAFLHTEIKELYAKYQDKYF
jgi:hypothetical protein